MTETKKKVNTKKNANKTCVVKKFTIIAIITKVVRNMAYVKGVGKHHYEDFNKKEWNLLEGNPIPLTRQRELDSMSSKMIDVRTPLSITCLNGIDTTIVAVAMVLKKPLKLTIMENVDKRICEITEIEVP